MSSWEDYNSLNATIDCCPVTEPGEASPLPKQALEAVPVIAGTAFVIVKQGDTIIPSDPAQFKP